MPEVIYPPALLLARTLFKGLGYRFVETGYENFPKTGPVVLASNHISYVDFILCGKPADSVGRKVRFMAKKSSFDNRISGPLMRNMKHIPVDRAAGAGAFDEAKRALGEGEIIGVFPEATISESYTVKDLKSGAARMAIETGAPLIPMVLFGTQRIYPKGNKGDRLRNACISISVGKPIPTTPTSDPDEVTKVLHETLTSMLDKVLEEYPEKPQPGEPNWWWPAHLGGSAPTREEMALIEAERAAALKKKFSEG